jgi:hypothetical protein
VTQLLALALAVLLPLSGLLHPAAAQAAQDAVLNPAPAEFRCEGEPLLAEVHGGTVPGAFIVLRWRGGSLQLPRTNNAGTPSYSDGRWWWQALDPQHPEFAQRRGDWEAYRCDAGA